MLLRRRSKRLPANRGLSEKQIFDQRCRTQDQDDNNNQQNERYFPTPDDIGVVEHQIRQRWRQPQSDAWRAHAVMHVQRVIMPLLMSMRDVLIV